MKKMMILSGVILLAYLLCACGRSNESVDSSICETEYVATDMDAFIADWQEACGRGADSVQHGVLSTEQSSAEVLLVPSLLIPEYSFLQVNANEHIIKYYYAPMDYQKTYVDYNEVILVTVAREQGTFDAVVEQYQLDVEDGMAYDAQRNCWHIDQDGYRVTVKFPESMVVDAGEDVKGMISFEWISASQPNGEVQ